MSHRIPVQQSRETLGNIAKELALLSGQLTGCVQAMQDSEISELGVPNHDQLMRAMDYFTKYTAEAWRSLRSERTRRGAFGAEKKKVKKQGKKARPIVSDSSSKSEEKPANTKGKHGFQSDTKAAS